MSEKNQKHCECGSAIEDWKRVCRHCYKQAMIGTNNTEKLAKIKREQQAAARIMSWEEEMASETVELCEEIGTGAATECPACGYIGEYVDEVYCPNCSYKGSYA